MLKLSTNFQFHNQLSQYQLSKLKNHCRDKHVLIPYIENVFAS